ncbi:MAG: hypothetical protein H6666_18295 [Ardenticatenaceae bacterium]|nr:hypothetical protein [Anaerolineales bacterium]MCB8919868.1 hypothetical protein [Ardenticatenaceae bacterium]
MKYFYLFALMLLLSLLVGCGQPEEDVLLPAGTVASLGLPTVAIKTATDPAGGTATPFPTSTPQAPKFTPRPTVTLVPGGVVSGGVASGGGGDRDPGRGDSGGASPTKEVRPTAATDECKTNCGDDGGSSGGGGRGGSDADSTPTAATAPVFGGTPIRDFTSSEFVSALEQVRDSFRSFNADWPAILTGARQQNPGDCDSYQGWYRLWTRNAPGFNSVPSRWEALYVEYRLLLQSAVTVTTDVRVQCGLNAGPYETGQDAVAFFATAYPRIEQMVVEAYQNQR